MISSIIKNSSLLLDREPRAYNVEDIQKIIRSVNLEL